MEIETLRKLQVDSKELVGILKEINAQLDQQTNTFEGMLDITKRISGSFKLYRTLVRELEIVGKH